MNRCTPRSSLAALAMAAGFLLPAAGLLLPTAAQAQRIFPKDAYRGEITFVKPPQNVLLNGQPERLAVGVRVLDHHNRVPLAGTLRGKVFVANYVRGPAGKIQQVWLLSEREAARPGKNETERRINLIKRNSRVDEVPAGFYNN